jgi:hypothetical protein
MTGGIDAAVDLVEPSLPQPVSDGLFADSRIEQLASRNNALLSLCQL